MIEIQESLIRNEHECLRECQTMMSRHHRTITVPDIRSIIGKFNTQNRWKNHGLLLEQQGWKFVSSKYKLLENAHQTRFGSN